MSSAALCSTCGTPLPDGGERCPGCHKLLQTEGTASTADPVSRVDDIKTDSGELPPPIEAGEATQPTQPHRPGLVLDGPEAEGDHAPVTHPAWAGEHDPTLALGISPTGSSSRRDPLIGTSLGEYVVEERVGIGGMGVVYRRGAAADRQLGGDQGAAARRHGRQARPAALSRRGAHRQLDRHRSIISIFGAADTLTAGSTW